MPTIPTQPGLSITPIVPALDGRLHIFDSYATWQATPKTAISFEGDYVVSRAWNEPGPGRDTTPSHVYGGALYARQQLTPKAALAARAEYLRDDGGLFSGATQSLNEVTLTYEYKVAEGFLMRGEWRRDASNTPFFLTRDAGVLDDRSEHGDARRDLVVGHQARRLVDTESLMLDLLYVVITLAFFLLAVAYVAACERLE